MKKIFKIMALSLVLILFTVVAATAADDPLKVEIPVEVNVEGAFKESKHPFTRRPPKTPPCRRVPRMAFTMRKLKAPVN